MQAKNIAIIDMGSNSIRLVINTIQSNGSYKELHNYKIVARLSSHVNEKNEITKKGINKIIDTVKKFSQIMEAHQVEKVIGVATAAIRNAQNQKQILATIEKETGHIFRVLSGYEEAFYGYLAVVNSTNIQDGITIDIGGGSTEITLFENRQLKHYHSFPFGAITLKQKFIKNDNPSEEEIANLTKFLRNQFASLPWLKKANLPVIGIGGTARNLSLIHQRKTNYPLPGIHQYELSKKDIEDVQNLLISTNYADRQNIDGLSKDRADIIIPGVQTILTLVDFIDAKNFIMSSKGLRDGIFYAEILKPLNVELFPDVTLENLVQLSRQFNMNEQDSDYLFKIAISIYEQLAPYVDSSLYNNDHYTLLKYSAKVFYIGEFINPEASSQHTFYLLTNMTIAGLAHKERLALAFIASFKSRSQMNEYYRPFAHLVAKEDLKRFEYLGAILKLSYALNRTRRNLFSDLTITKPLKNQLVIHLFCATNPYFEEQYANKHKKHLEKVISQQITIQIENV